MISTAQFHAAIARHIDETKPNPLAKRQLERISLSWKEDEEDEEEKLALRNQRQQQQNNRTSLEWCTYSVVGIYFYCHSCSL
jgi:hypothetical protein